MKENIKGFCDIKRFFGYIPELFHRVERKFHHAVLRLRDEREKRILQRILSRFNADDLQSELRRQHKSFAYLLESCFCLIRGAPKEYFSTAEMLHEAWQYRLNSGRTPELLQLYERIGRKRDKEAALRLWMKYLQGQGFHRMYAEQDVVIISRLVKEHYDNILGLEDGVSLPIESHPWMYENELIASGMLKR